MLLGAARPRCECEINLTADSVCLEDICASTCRCGTLVFHDRNHCSLGYLSHNKVHVCTRLVCASSKRMSTCSM